MLHGIESHRFIYYALAVLDGDGQNFRNADGQLDLMGRAWVAPGAFLSLDAVKRITVGGSFWTGLRRNGLPLPTQSTQAGFTFFKPSWSVPGSMGAPGTPSSCTSRAASTPSPPS
jgi:hypothetical protein